MQVSAELQGTRYTLSLIAGAASNPYLTNIENGRAGGNYREEQPEFSVQQNVRDATAVVIRR